MKSFLKVSPPIVLASIIFSCTHPRGTFPIVQDSVAAETQVTAGGNPVKLYGEGRPLQVGRSIGAYLEAADGAVLSGKVVVMNFVPSIDTPVCEEQTHELSEMKADPSILRVSMSRDLPMAQKRFAKDAGLGNLIYLSDYKSGFFGRKGGVMMQGSELLARGVLVVDKKGIIRHLQIVPNVATLPDLKKAFAIAEGLVKEP